MFRDVVVRGRRRITSTTVPCAGVSRVGVTGRDVLRLATTFAVNAAFPMASRQRGAAVSPPLYLTTARVVMALPVGVF